MMHYKSINFKAEELVDPVTFKKFGNRSLQICLDSRILWQMDSIRNWFGKPVYVNNWKYGGKFKFRGFRPSSCKVGSVFSQHRFGRAIDFDVKDLTAEEVRQEIIRNQFKDDFKFITRLEDNVNWVHMDCTNFNFNGIYLFKD